MTDLYVTDKKGRHVYHVYNVKTPYGGVIRTIKYDFGDKNYGIAFVARDCGWGLIFHLSTVLIYVIIIKNKKIKNI